jgi:hypothetical protein
MPNLECLLPISTGYYVYGEMAVCIRNNVDEMRRHQSREGFVVERVMFKVISSRWPSLIDHNFAWTAVRFNALFEGRRTWILRAPNFRDFQPKVSAYY